MIYERPDLIKMVYLQLTGKISSTLLPVISSDVSGIGHGLPS